MATGSHDLKHAIDLQRNFRKHIQSLEFFRWRGLLEIASETIESEKLQLDTFLPDWPIRFMPDGERVIFPSSDDQFAIFNTTSGKLEKYIHMPIEIDGNGAITAYYISSNFAISPDGKKLIVLGTEPIQEYGAFRGGFEVDLDTEETKRIQLGENNLFLADGRIVSADYMDDVEIDGKSFGLCGINPGDKAVKYITLSRQGKYVYVMSHDGLAAAYDVENLSLENECIFRERFSEKYMPYSQSPRYIEFCPGRSEAELLWIWRDNWLEPQGVYTYDVEMGEHKFLVDGLFEKIAIDEDGKTLFLITNENSLLIYDLGTKKEIANYELGVDPNDDVKISRIIPSRDRILVAFSDGTFKVFGKNGCSLRPRFSIEESR